MAKLIEPWMATAVARRFAGGDDLDRSYLVDRLRRDLTTAVPRSEELVADVSGIPAPPPVRWEVIDRGRWVEANIRSLTELLGPLGEKIARRLEAVPFPVRLAQRYAMSVEVGVLFGYVSRRVLGQYDLLVPEGDRRGHAPLYFVGPNMVETERRFGFVPQEFTLWVAVHEVTHRFQFEGVPWLRSRFIELVHRYLDSVDLDPKSFAKRLGTAARRLVREGIPAPERNAAYLLAGPEQRATLDQIQALMAVIEGHGNWVMDTVGERVIPSFRQMRGVFQRRREQTSVIQKAVNNAIGLEMKLRQYELGQKFCEGVAGREGPEALRHLWTDPEQFPTLEELKEPDTWLRRVAA